MRPHRPAPAAAPTRKTALKTNIGAVLALLLGLTGVTAVPWICTGFL